jgi:hypothetical protein
MTTTPQAPDLPDVDPTEPSIDPDGPEIPHSDPNRDDGSDADVPSSALDSF